MKILITTLIATILLFSNASYSCHGLEVQCCDGDSWCECFHDEKIIKEKEQDGWSCSW